jgi:hypothetical protein
MRRKGHRPDADGVIVGLLAPMRQLHAESDVVHGVDLERVTSVEQGTGQALCRVEPERYSSGTTIRAQSVHVQVTSESRRVDLLWVARDRSTQTDGLMGDMAQPSPDLLKTARSRRFSTDILDGRSLTNDSSAFAFPVRKR